MVRLVLLIVLFLFSLLIIFRAPANLLWYLAIIVSELSWVFILLVMLLLCWPGLAERYLLWSWLIGFAALVLYTIPYWQAWRLSRSLPQNLAASLSIPEPQGPAFRLAQVITGIGTRKVPYQALTYDRAKKLHLHFYAAEKSGIRPCIVVIHGGSWAAGDNLQLPELNSELAKDGYHVASINYRLAPDNRFPAPVDDVDKALLYLKEEAVRLQIDTNRFALLGRSAGGQVALSSAIMLKQPGIRAVINFYGPTDMVWGYQHPTNPLVLDSRGVMERYLGGTLAQVPDQYIQSSATETIRAGTPPVLMIYPGNDPLVSPLHGDRLRPKLQAANIRHVWLYLPWATHAFDYSLNGPGGQLSTWTVKRFLEAMLR